MKRIFLLGGAILGVLGLAYCFVGGTMAQAQTVPLISPVSGTNDAGLASQAIVISRGTSMDFAGGTGTVLLYSLDGQTLSMDAGANLSQVSITNGTTEGNSVPTVTYMDQAAPKQVFAMECGVDAGSTGALSVTLHFANVGATLPVCWCNEQNAAQKACNPSAAVTAANASFIDEGGGSDLIHWCCVGPK